MWLTLLGLVGTPLALAEPQAEPPPAEPAPPLAIPAGTPSPRGPAPVARAPAASPEAISGRAWSEYRSRTLVLRPLTEWTVMSSGWGPYGWWGAPYGWGGVWVSRHDAVAVYQGPQRLDVPEVLGALGDVPGRMNLERRIRNQRRAGRVLTGIGLVGLTGTLVGLVGMDTAVTWDQARDWSAVTWTGAGLMVGGLVAGGIPSDRARRLQVDPELTFGPSELQQRVDAHNDRLARELGIDPDRVPAEP